MNKLQSLILIITLLVGSVSVAIAQSFDKGLEAYIASDYQTTLQEWRPLADQGDATAQTLLGLMYRNGQGVPQDFTTAASWVRKAADQGVAEAQFELGLMYAAGQGVPQEPTEAVKLYRQAAQQGYAKAQSALGDIYWKGWGGVPKDTITSHMWHNISSANGLDFSAQMRDIIQRTMTAQDIAKAQQMASECLSSNYQNCGY